MDPSTLKSQWSQWREPLRQRFSELDAAELAAIDGDPARLTEVLQVRYGWDRDRVDSELTACFETATTPAGSVPFTVQARATLGPGAAKVREGLAEIGAGLRTLAGDAAQHAGHEARERGEQVAQIAAAAQARAGDALGDAGDAAQRMLAGTEKFVRERPFTAVGIAFLAGWVLFSRR